MDFELRKWKYSDLDRLVKYANNKLIADRLMDHFPHPYTTEDGKKFIVENMAPNPPNVLAIAVEEGIIGAIGIHIQKDIMRKNAELGYWLAEEYWGQGITTQAIKRMVDYAFKHFDISRIYARPMGTNIASKKVLEKAGFILEARIVDGFFKNGVYEDELIYATRR